ncbi:hypothetical protein [Geobacillus sp. C56-T2]|nr:hypothetical protein [Geobacillus sp. C56-T2]
MDIWLKQAERWNVEQRRCRADDRRAPGADQDAASVRSIAKSNR